MKNLIKSGFLVTALLLPLALSARVLPHHSAGVQINVPGNWEQDIDGDFLAINDPNEEAILMFIVMESGQVEDALDALDDAMSEIVTESDMEEPEEVTLNGMPAIVADGTGMADGTPVELGVAVIRTPTDKALIVIGLVAQEASDRHEDTLSRVIQSIKPIN